MSKIKIVTPEAVLEALKGHFGPFVLTGGAALSRYYLHHRTSFDLDLITPANPAFRTSAEAIAGVLRQVFGMDHIEVLEYKGFYRITLPGDPSVKVEMINDIDPERTVPVFKDGIPLDSVSNILANKINCMMERDHPADLADVVAIAGAYAIDWSEALRQARRKAMLAQAFILEKIIRKLSGFMLVTGNREPADFLATLGIPSPLKISYHVVFLEISRLNQYLAPGSGPLTLEGIIGVLAKLRENLETLAARTDAQTMQEEKSLPTVLNFDWGGASITVLRREIVTAKFVADRIACCPKALDQS